MTTAEELAKELDRIIRVMMQSASSEEYRVYLDVLAVLRSLAPKTKDIGFVED